ncbi:hypothetical protein H257_08720 [Aphanomyces astaci]|uniref:FYVE-type domain-containing protein n=1 Tax=Aphanomyces astaci TaxID=112090 RepID=W4GC57_APHAT|nr:hypothetical protein H257_08720 [Aphanomyces astaci]ETV77267.1 hypothetical protein H257_08720 [Aphanomyces astaci]|eukprot:XP_009833054.1 hypothetical protein H257_08720 [Aphanomyces astaci]
MLGTFEPVMPYDFAVDEVLVTAKYQRASKLVTSVFNKYHNGSHRAVDTVVVSALLQEEDALFGLQCLVEQGPAAICRERKESEVRTITSQTTINAVQGSWFPTLTLCGGLLGTPNTIMRKWDMLGDISKLTAMQEYIELLNTLLPGWDDQSEFPVSLPDHFWKQDAAAIACASCHTPFSMQLRRHHCRMCFDIYCHPCSPFVVDLQLSAGAPARPARVCATCKAAIDNDKGLLEVRRLLHENRELKVRIQTIAQDTDTTVNAQLAVAATLRTDAIAQGCNMLAVDKSIQSKWREDDNPALDLHVKTPPAHKFRPSESVEASEQLRVANRQLVMCLKVAETRAKKALDKVEITTAVLQEAIQNQRKPWRPIARLIVPFLTVVDIKRLAQTARPFQAYIATLDLERESCIRLGFPVHFRPQFWMWRACHDPDTHKYVCDLAEAVTSHLGGASAADEDSDEALHWSSIMLKASPTWSEAYALVVAKCGENGCLEHDKQILADVDRTFGRSSLRKQARKLHVSVTDVDEKKLALARVLRAFTATHTTMGYCQGMNFLTAFMLSNVQWNEAQAFWLVTAIAVSPQYQLMELYRPGVPLLNLRFYQLHSMVQQLLPDLHAHFEAEDFHVSMCASGWFMTLFTNCDTLPADAVVRVLDCFLVYGWKIIFQVALALLQFLQVRAFR